MGRKRTSRLDLPERVYYHHNAYYYAHRSGKWENLGADYVKAMAIWATRIAEQCAEVVTVGELLNRYIVEVVPTKAERTQKDNLHEIRYLRAFFGEPRMSMSSVTRDPPAVPWDRMWGYPWTCPARQIAKTCPVGQTEKQPRGCLVGQPAKISGGELYMRRTRPYHARSRRLGRRGG